MANRAFSSKARESSLAEVVTSHISSDADLLNAVDFVESPMGLAIALYPVQRVILKLIYGIPMDYKEKMVPIYDVYGEELTQTLKETDYLQWVSEQGRCNIFDWRDAQPDGYEEASLLIGRRGGKSQLASAIASYKLYLMLSIYSPQEYYGLVPGSPIDILALAQDETGAGRLFSKIREDVLRSPFFSPYLRSPNARELKFVSESDRKKKDATATISVVSLPCTTNAARGPSSALLLLDEICHFRSDRGSSSDEVYNAATPATLQFKHPETGRKDSKIIMISSPLKRLGIAYDIFKLGLANGPKSGILSFRCSTAEMNPKTPTGSLRQEYEKSPLSFKCEYAANFIDSTESYVKSKQLDICVDEGRENVSHFYPDLVGYKYFWGFDLGMRNDASALAVGHWEYKAGRPCLVYDYIDRLMVGEGDYVDAPELKLEHIIKWMDRIQKLLPCFQGVTDQHGGTMLVQLLNAYGIEGMELIHLSPSLNSKMYHAFKGLIDQGAARFPNVPKFVLEVKNLEAEIISKYMIRVAAPEEKGSHDDMADAAALVAMIAVEWAQGDGAREMADLITSPALVKQGIFGFPSLSMDIEFASLSDLRMLERQAQVRKNQMGMQSKLSSLRRFR